MGRCPPVQTSKGLAEWVLRPPKPGLADIMSRITLVPAVVTFVHGTQKPPASASEQPSIRYEGIFARLKIAILRRC